MLPSKTIPEAKNRKRNVLKAKAMAAAAATPAAPPRKKARISSGTEGDIGGEASSRTRCSSDAAEARSTVSPASSFHMSYPVPAKVREVS